MLGFLSFIGWLALSYYVLSTLFFVGIVYAMRPMYRAEGARAPWPYFRFVLIPFIGFWLFLLTVAGDISVHLDNEAHRDHEKSLDHNKRGGGDTED